MLAPIPVASEPIRNTPLSSVANMPKPLLIRLNPAEITPPTTRSLRPGWPGWTTASGPGLPTSRISAAATPSG